MFAILNSTSMNIDMEVSPCLLITFPSSVYPELGQLSCMLDLLFFDKYAFIVGIIYCRTNVLVMPFSYVCYIL